MGYYRILFLFLSIGFIATSCSDKTPTSSGTGNGNSNGNGEITTEFTLVVNASPEEGGTVAPEGESVREDGEEVEVTAYPEYGWEFIRWEGGLSGEDNPGSITVNSEKSVQAIFEEIDIEFSGGSGIEGDPYQVETLNQLQAINDYTDAHFIQIDDIDASATASWNDGRGFNPIGDDVVKFTGSYDGAGFEITNLTIERDEERYIGLFGHTQGAIIKNTAVVNVNISAEHFIGGLVGANVEGEISNSYVTGDVSGRSFIGGLVGSNGFEFVGGDISNSHAEVNVSGSGYEQVGGLIGFNKGGEIKNSYATGAVSGSNARGVGGLIGENQAQVIDSYATGDVSGPANTGGLVGFNNSGIISDSYSTGNVSGIRQIGGLVGTGGVINNSYSTGNVEGDISVGGLLGAGGEIINSYATGYVEGENSIGGLAGVSGNISYSYSEGSVLGNNSVGGLVGVNRGKIENSYARGSAVGDTEVGGVAGVNRDEGEIISSFSTGQVRGNDDVGGLIGLNGADLNSSYWDTESSEQSDGVGRGLSSGVTGLTTSEIQGLSAEENMPDFDWDEVWLTTSEYPILQWQN